MNHELLYDGAFTMLKVNLKQGESIKAESNAMVSMSTTIDLDGKLEGGVLGGLGRMLAGEKFFFQTLRATRGEGEVLLAPAMIGGIVPIQMNGGTYIVQKDGFLASSEGVNIETKVQNLVQGLFSGEGFFVLKASGYGNLFVSSLGSILLIDLVPNEEIIIDNYHLVAWESNLNYTIEKASKSGWISSITSGEGLVTRFRGPGKVYIQSRNPKAFGHWLNHFMTFNR